MMLLCVLVPVFDLLLFVSLLHGSDVGRQVDGQAYIYIYIYIYVCVFHVL